MQALGTDRITYHRPDDCRRIQQRYILSLLGSLALALGHVHRFCLSLAIVEMAEQQTHVESFNTGTGCSAAESPVHGNITAPQKTTEFDWDEKTQRLVLSSFFWGYTIMQIPGGVFADKYSGKATLGLGMLISSIGTIMTPLVTRAYGSATLIVLRLIIGLAQGPMYPALSRLLASWVPAEERGQLGSLVFAGAQMGNIVTAQLGGFLIQRTKLWSSVFYIFGVLGIFWLMFWFVLVYNHPNRNPFISSKEKTYLNGAIKTVDMNNDLLTIPWKQIATSGPVWGLIIVQIGHDWNLHTVITYLPKYMKSVLQLSVAENGILFSLPYILMWTVTIGSGFLVDSMITSGRFTATCTRKTFAIIANVGPALGIIAVSYSGCDKVWTVAGFTIGMTLMGTYVSSLQVNPLDLSPNYAGMLTAIVGTIGSLFGIVAPKIVDVMLPNNTMEEWRYVFWLSAFIMTSTCLVFLQYGSADMQPWNEKLQCQIIDTSNENNVASTLKPIDNSVIK